MLLLSELRFGDLKTQTYTFEKAGDVLPEHEHNEDTIHITIVCKGKVDIKCMGFSRIASAGEIIDFNINQPHEVVALEDDTKIVNALKHYK